MSVTVLILAAGEQKRWEMSEPLYYKQLLDVGGETIIARIERQVIQRGFFPRRITIHRELEDPWSYRPEYHRWTVETLLSTYYLWQSCTVVLLGDVIYSRATMDRIFKPHNQKLKVFGNEYEIYALSMVDDALEKKYMDFGDVYFVNMTTALKASISHAESGVAKGGGKLRKFYQAYCGLNMTGNAIEWNVLHKVDDYTHDVDNPEDYAALLKKIKDGTIDDLEIK